MAGLLVLQLWGVYCVYTWLVLKGEHFTPPWSQSSQGILESLTGNDTWVTSSGALFCEEKACIVPFKLRKNT